MINKSKSIFGMKKDTSNLEDLLNLINDEKLETDETKLKEYMKSMSNISVFWFIY